MDIILRHERYIVIFGLRKCHNFGVTGKLYLRIKTRDLFHMASLCFPKKEVGNFQREKIKRSMISKHSFICFAIKSQVTRMVIEEEIFSIKP